MEPILHCTLFPKHHAGVRLHHRCTAVRPHRSSSVQGQIAAPEHHSVPSRGDLPGQLAPPVQAETTACVAARNATVSPCTVGRLRLLCSLHTRNVPTSSSSSLYRRKKSTFRRVIPLEVARTWSCTVERSRRFSRVISTVQVEEVDVPSSYSPRSCADLALYSEKKRAFRGDLVEEEPKVPTTAHLTSCAVEGGGRPMRISEGKDVQMAIARVFQHLDQPAHLRNGSKRNRLFLGNRMIFTLFPCARRLHRLGPARPDPAHAQQFLRDRDPTSDELKAWRL